MSAVKANRAVHAVIIAGYPGQEGGNAIAQTVFGDNNPAGRLTQTWFVVARIVVCPRSFSSSHVNGASSVLQSSLQRHTRIQTRTHVRTRSRSRTNAR